MGPPFDAVLILGKELRRDPERARRELRARAAAAAVAVRAGAAFVATLEARLRGQDITGSELVAGYLVELGVPEERILRRDQSRSTREEAVLGTALFAERGVRRGLVLTARYHVPRVRRLFAEAGAPVEVRAPDELSRGATPRELTWIREGEASAATFADEAASEALFGALEHLLGPLPYAMRARLEIEAGGWFRRATER